ncbi:MAG TPA: hypothetical protein VN736_29460 [Candidatus Limnocylindrales bacterium]|nr:hypothetical protein [Candidatus Limnocylindrales bacterium]
MGNLKPLRLHWQAAFFFSASTQPQTAMCAPQLRRNTKESASMQVHSNQLLTAEQIERDAQNRARYASVRPVDVFGKNASSLLQAQLYRDCACLYRELRDQFLIESGLKKLRGTRKSGQ